jgi:SP family general alpha glucoside:H+ symporter-like MFS transporter
VDFSREMTNGLIGTYITSRRNSIANIVFSIPFAIQWIWPVPILLGCIFAPESPWWLVRKGRIDEARYQLLRLTSRSDQKFDVDPTIAMMQHTNELEKSASEGTSYLDCFRGEDLRRTEIVCLTWVVQALCGSTFMYVESVFQHKKRAAES